MAQIDFIEVFGAREHNLKNLSLKIPRNKISVITGLSGSGKSSLAFDTIYAEGQRRYLEGLSAYAKNFLEQLKKPDVDAINGLSPSISIDQKTTASNPKSTVGTLTELYDFLRLLFSKVGEAHCPNGHGKLSASDSEQICDEICSLKEGSKINLLAPVARQKKGEFSKEIALWIKMGFVRAKIDGEILELDKVQKLQKTKAHDIDVVLDRIIINSKIRPRINTAVMAAEKISSGQILVEFLDKDQVLSFSTKSSCSSCGFGFPEMDPKSFSFNNPKGACPSCHGFGFINFEELEYSLSSENEETSLNLKTCPDCKGTRLKVEGRNVFIDSMNIHAWSELSIEELLEKTKTLKFSNRQKLIAEKIIEQIQDRLNFLDRVGASYLSLNRPSFTLSGGEAQRIRLASQIAAGLVGVLYVLDEPSIGLHPQDHSHLLSIINEIRDRGNTVIIVEHDEESILCSDYVFDLGPGAGIHGGEIMARGTPKELMANPKSITGNYLSGRQKVFRPNKTRKIDMKNALVVEGAQANNLKNINVQIPLQTFTTITGVSGSGKSSLAIDTIYQYLANEINDNSFDLPKYKNIKGAEKIERLVNINQKPIGRTPRSNPATYTGLFSAIRELFAGLPDSKIRGFKLGHFSFNVKGGRCEACEGAGKIKVEMNFLSNVYVDCDTCQGKRYNRETMGIRYKSKNIADVLDMDVSEACVFFENHKSIHVKLQTLERVGLGYIKLGQSSTTLSGGEAQRIKLSKELSKRIQGGGFYILDEPTTGLHFADISKLIELLHELVDLGNSVFVIEHNLDVMAASDYLIELGPSGGPKGGNLINQGTPKDFCQNPKSPTAKYLKNLFL